jgi:hypothetical protein
MNPEREDGWVTVAPEEIATWAAEGCSFHLDCDEYWECFDVTHGKIEDGDQFMSGAFRPPDDELAKYQFRGGICDARCGAFLSSELRSEKGVDGSSERRSARKRASEHGTGSFSDSQHVSAPIYGRQQRRKADCVFTMGLECGVW